VSLPAHPDNAPLCECDSGLTRERCCQLNLKSLGAREASRHLQPLEESAIRVRKDGDQNLAERLLLDVLELAPTRITALSALYEIRKAAGKKRAALALIGRLVSLDANNFWATNELALLLLAQGDVAGALRHARNAMRLAPQSAQSHYLMAMALTEARRPALSEYHYGRALELSGQRDPAVLSNLALCLKNQGKMQQARALYAESLAAAPHSLHALLGAARLEEADRQLDAAKALIVRAETLQPNNPSIHMLRAIVLGRQGDSAGALEALDRSPDDARLAPGELLERGRLLDRVGRYEAAFAAFDTGKERLRELSGHAYLDVPARQLAQRLTSFFTARRMATLPRAARRKDMAQPLFVVGFPRSGTTLLEQSLTAHPRIEAGDELPFIGELAEVMPRVLESPLSYPDALAELWMADHREDLDSLRDLYLRKVAQLGVLSKDAVWFTDKMPLNETHLGLIHLVFPDSPILHVIRHPLDVVVSAYSNLLTHGFYCAYALETVARHYVLIHDLVARYRKEIDLKYLSVRYEDLVDRQEETLRQVLSFVGEEFDASCLAFHENRRYARTASYAQVTEKLYDRSRYRYRNYLSQLQPVIPILEPVIADLGYDI
jgi:Flp pilus assembly protein TadD